MFCSLTELTTESDVEQKLLFPLLTAAAPLGLGLGTPDILTKMSIRRLEIDKGSRRRLYFPDYMVVIAGLPVVVVEAKAPSESLGLALDEARLYGNEINALFPSGINPCIRVVVCNGHELWSGPLDSAQPDITLNHVNISPANVEYSVFVDQAQRSALQQHADGIRRRFRRPKYLRPVSEVGGDARQNQELPTNTFGSTIVGDFGHLFSPQTKQDRELIARHAYIPSLRRQRYLEPIDRLIRQANKPLVGGARVLDDTGNPAELTKALRERRRLENQVLLLVGSVGSGKSTFVDHVSLVALPEDVKAKSLWVRVNLNEAPLARDVAYNWLARAIIDELRSELPEGHGPDDLETLQKIFRPELTSFKKGAVSLLDPESNGYQTRVADELIRLHTNPIIFAKSFARYLCAGPGKLLVIVLDNCDKRTRDDQLTMFQVAQWVQWEFRSLVILPLRDITFERHRHEPPLDTALKGLVFRIEPPRFTEVLQARVRLALQEMQANASTGNTLSYVLPNGIRVSYPASDQAFYLASILNSLYAHDRFVRRIMTGLAGRDVRRALEIFLDFCMSGHIGEDEIYKIRFFEGQYALPLSVVTRVLLKVHRRFYDGDKAYIKNLVQCDTSDPLPDHFVRLAILYWLEKHQNKEGPAGVRGFHAAGKIVNDLVQLGHDANRVRAELLYLVKGGCVIPEHLQSDKVDHDDLVMLTASGLVHLQLMANPDYLAACAEDTYLSDQDLVKRVVARIVSRDTVGHFSRLTTARNASEFVEYLKAKAAERIGSSEVYLASSFAVELKTLREAEAAVGATEIDVSTRLYVGNLSYSCSAQRLRDAFKESGVELTNVEIPEQAGKSRGFAFVETEDGKAAMAALDLTDLVIDGRRLVVNEAYQSERGGRVGPRSVRAQTEVSERLYVGNLSNAATEQSIRQLFADHGFRLLDVYIAIERPSRLPKGFAFVSLASADEAERAIGALHGSSVDGRPVIVRPAAPRAAQEAPGGTSSTVNASA